MDPHQDSKHTQRGASSITVAFLMVFLLSVAAISVDIGRIHWEKVQLQNGADAAALAIASNCLTNESSASCNPGITTSQLLADNNANDNASEAEDPKVDVTANSVTVTTLPRAHGASEPGLTSWFAHFLGIDMTYDPAEATAIWGTPRSANDKFALAFAECELILPAADTPESEVPLQFLRAHGKESMMPDEEGNISENCAKNPSGQHMPGGFGWLAQDGDCKADTVIGDRIGASGLPGASLKPGCGAILNKWRSILEDEGSVTVLLPIFNEADASAKTYKIFAYAAIRIEGWQFPGNFYRTPDAEEFWNPPGSKGKPVYNSSDHGFIGKFVHYVFSNEDSDLGDYDDTQGAKIVRLVN